MNSTFLNETAARLPLINSTNSYYPLEFRVMATILHGILGSIGIIGNIMVITVVLRVKGMVTPTNCYLLSLAISDCLFFISAMPIELTYYHLPKFVYLFGAVFCKAFTFLPYLAINASSLAIAAFTVERYIGICHPMRAQYVCTVRRAKVIIAVLWVFSILYNSPWLVLADLEKLHYADWPNAKRCYYKLSRNTEAYKIQYLFDIMAFYVIPLLLYLVLYGRIAAILMNSQFEKTKSTDAMISRSNSSNFKANRRVMAEEAPSIFCRESDSQAMGGGGGLHGTLSVPTPTDPLSGGRSRANSTCSTTGVIRSPSSLTNTSSNAGADSKVAGMVQLCKSRIQVVKMLVVVVVVFAVCWLPYRGLVVYNSFAARPWQELWYIFVAKTMIFLNSAINPILYSIMSVKFRRAFRSLIKACCHKASLNPYNKKLWLPLKTPKTSTTSLKSSTCTKQTTFLIAKPNLEISSNVSSGGHVKHGGCSA